MSHKKSEEKREQGNHKQVLTSKEENMGNSTQEKCIVNFKCPVCFKAAIEYEMVSRNSTELEYEFMDRMNGKALGFIDRPCDKCQEDLKDGFIIIIYDKARTKDMDDPFRLGIVTIKARDITRLSDDVKKEYENNIGKVTMMDVKEALKLGIIKQEELNEAFEEYRITDKTAEETGHETEDDTKIKDIEIEE